MYGTGALDLVPVQKLKTVYKALLFALAMTYILQFFNEMTPRALVVSFIPGMLSEIILTPTLSGFENLDEESLKFKIG